MAGANETRNEVLNPEVSQLKSRLDRQRRFCLAAICVLLTILVSALLLAIPSTCAPAHAGPAVQPTEPQLILPDTAAQRLAQIEATKGTNDRLDKIISLLESGKLKVIVAEASEEEKNSDASNKPKK